MNNRFLKLVSQYKENPSEELIQELQSSYENGLDIRDLYDDHILSEMVLKDIPKEFCAFIAKKLVEDLNDFPLMYFLTYERFLSLLEPVKLSQIYQYALDISEGTDAFDFINGFIKLDENSPEIALFSFNRINNYIADYFIGLCYQEIQNFENAIINNLSFLNGLSKIENTTINDDRGNEIRLADIETISFTKWYVLNDIAYCYNAIKEFEKAISSFNESLENTSLEDNFKINYEDLSDNTQTDLFLLFVNNYLYALEKTHQFEEAVKVLDFVIENVPNNYVYIKQKELFVKKAARIVTADEIIKQLYKPKKPYGISEFETTKLISKEKALEDLILEQIKYGFRVFNKNLEIYQDDTIYGRQYYISSVNGFLDLLLIEKETNQIYLVELKRNKAGIEVVEQTEKYMLGLSQELKRDIKGIICLHKPKPELVDLVNSKDNIELFTYNFDFDKLA